MRANTELNGLRQQLGAVQPDRLEELLERVAPYATKLLGYVELARAVLPDVQRAMDSVRQPRQAEPAPPPQPEPAYTRPVRVVEAPSRLRRAVSPRHWSWRTRAVMGAVPVLAGLAAYGAWRWQARGQGRGR